MQIDCSDERRLFDQSLLRYLADHYTWDERQHSAWHSRDQGRSWRGLCDLGATGALFEPDKGGFGGQAEDIALIFEALGRHLVVEPFLPALMSGIVLGRTGRDDWLNGIIEGTALVVLAEVDDAADPLVATPSGGGWRLSGGKSLVVGAESASAFVVSARTGEHQSLFLIDPARPGLSISGYGLIDGGRGGDVRFSQVEAGAGDLLGPIDGAEALVGFATDAGLLALAAEALGAAETAKAMTIDHLRTRRQFGVSLAQFQSLQHRIVELAMEIEQARSAVENVIAVWAGDDRARRRALAAAKFTTGRMARLVAEEAIQLHGAIGMSWELPISHYSKRLVMVDAQLGSADQHLGAYIAMASEARTG